MNGECVGIPGMPLGLTWMGTNVVRGGLSCRTCRDDASDAAFRPTATLNPSSDWMANGVRRNRRKIARFVESLEKYHVITEYRSIIDLYGRFTVLFGWEQVIDFRSTSGPTDNR